MAKLGTTSMRALLSIDALKSFYALTKPRVCALIVFTAIIGMFLATPGIVPLDILFFASIGIAFVSGAAAAFNCLIEEKIDAMMARTKGRPLPLGQVSQKRNYNFFKCAWWIRFISPLCLCQSINRMADVTNILCLCGNLYSFS